MHFSTALPKALIAPQILALDEIKTHRWKIVASSAVSGMGLKEGIDWVVSDAKERMFLF